MSEMKENLKILCFNISVVIDASSIRGDSCFMYCDIIGHIWTLECIQHNSICWRNEAQYQTILVHKEEARDFRHMLVVSIHGDDMVCACACLCVLVGWLMGGLT
jgi:hypothetical protein